MSKTPHEYMVTTSEFFWPMINMHSGSESTSVSTCTATHIHTYHTHTHITYAHHTYAHMHTYTHTHTHIHTHMHMHTHTHMRRGRPACAYAHARYVHTHMHMHVCVRIAVPASCSLRATAPRPAWAGWSSRGTTPARYAGRGREAPAQGTAHAPQMHSRRGGTHDPATTSKQVRQVKPCHYYESSRCVECYYVTTMKVAGASSATMSLLGTGPLLCAGVPSSTCR